MGHKQKDKKEKHGKKEAAPTPTKKKLERKRCRSPRGLKIEKTRDKLLQEVDQPFPRHRNNYNQHMAQVKKLARML